MKLKIVYLDRNHPVALEAGNCGFQLISVSQDGCKAIVESIKGHIEINCSSTFEVDFSDLKQ